MPPMKLVCRGSDPRAMKGFVAASLSGREVAFEPMLKGAEGHGGSPIALELPDGRLRLSEGNAIARYLGGDALAPADATTRWKSERWQEWESTTLSPAVALACASKDVAPLAALLASSLDVALGAAGGGVSVSICGGDDVTLADVVVFVALYPVFADGGAAIPGAADALSTASSPTAAWHARTAANAEVAAALELSKASAATTAAFYAADGRDAQLARAATAPPADPSAEKFCITTAINYANGAPHMGHAYEAISTDCIARYHRAYGRDVLYQTGSDEHGQKIAEAAETAGCEPIELCDKYVAAFQDLNAKTSVANDVYNRTTSPEHHEACGELFRRSRDNGDIYLDTYEGWYNVREEMFVTETDAAAADYKDPVSGKPLKKMSEESYFFRMSKYQSRLIEYIEENPEFIQPTRRRNEILARLREDELRDLSVSRTTFDWGIPVPDAPGHVLYVWFDALTNYLTGVGWPKKEVTDGGNPFWPPAVQIIGKDITWFHCVIWPCMLFSAKIPLPKTVFGHGFVTASDGQKMSKSIGNVVDPLEQLAKYPSDSFRYYLMRNGVYGSDIPFSEANLVYVHNADLADVLGNLVHRATNLCAKNCAGVVPDVAPERVFDVGALRATSEHAMKNLETQKCCELAINAMKDTNKYLTDAAPWAVKGDGAAERKAVIIRSTLEAVYAAAHFLSPFIPAACDHIFEKLGAPAKPIWRLSRESNLTPGTTVSVGGILFAKFEVEGENAEGGASGGGGDGKKKGKAATAPPPPKKKEPPKDAPVDVSRLCIRVGTITKVWRHPDAEKLYCELIDIGESAPRQVVSGLVDHVPEDEMLGARVVVVANMKARSYSHWYPYDRVGVVNFIP